MLCSVFWLWGRPPVNRRRRARRAQTPAISEMVQETGVD